MRITLVSPYDWSVAGGVKSHVRHLADEFRDRGHDVFVFAPAARPWAARAEGMEDIGRIITVRGGGSRQRVTPFWHFRRVRKALAESQPDIVHLHEPVMPMLPATFLAQARCPVVATFHAARESSHPLYRLGSWVGKRALARIDGHIAVSPAARELAARYIDARFEIIPNGLDFDHFRDPAPAADVFADGRPTILFVGRPEPRKGLDYLLPAFDRLRARSEVTPRLLVVGAGDFARYERPGDPDVVFRTHVTYDELAGYYQGADIVCAPNTGNESQGYVIMEAMAAGRAVVASDIPGFRSVITNSHDGVLVPPRDAPAIAGAVEALLTNPAERARLGAAAVATARRYSWETVATDVLSFYEQTIQRARAGRAGGSSAADRGGDDGR